MRILVCGGAGYIGSHTCVALGEAGHDIVVLDNFCNSSAAAVSRSAELIGRPITLVQGDLRDRADLARAFQGGIDAVIHFAALKAVGDSCARPLDYFHNNISGTIALLQAMESRGVRKLVFSSSATVYGEPDSVPIAESAPLRVTNPYGRTKLVVEDMIRDTCAANPDFSAVILRYFNPVGAHPSGRIGEDPTGAPANLMPFVSQVAVGRRDRVLVFGNDYPTRDGTGVRDYIHVVDLAEAHCRALEFDPGHGACAVFNLGTGRGYSVKELISSFEAVTGRSIPYTVVDRRPGDVAELWADVSLAKDVLGWEARLDLDRMCADSWRWQSDNPLGYGSEEFEK